MSHCCKRFCAPLAIGLTLWVGLCVATKRVVASEQEPSILVLLVATNEQQRQREGRFVSELQMAIDRMDVVPVRPNYPNFIDLSLNRQIQVIRPLLQRHRGLVAVWLAGSGKQGGLLLNVMVLSSGQTLVKMFETTPSQGFELDLALVTKELIGTAFLFPHGDEPTPPAIRQIARSVQTKVVRLDRGFGAAFFAKVETFGGVTGNEGPSLMLGSCLGADFWSGGDLRYRVLLGLLGGPLRQTGQDQLSIWTLQPGLALAYLPQIGPVRFGGSTAVQVNWSHLSLQREGRYAQAFTDWGVTFSVGAESQVQVGWLALVLAANFHLIPQRDGYRLESTGEIVYAGPGLAWSVSIGAALPLPL